ncbi:hypothetical protein BaRGS_00018140 [Batillaria attramentaria]|uniref:Uncharacterized protein n=1 Tax=Batillaria attramentaria TaxID=370345 RepID=A0ABD0KTZ0_9CAEN
MTENLGFRTSWLRLKAFESWGGGGYSEVTVASVKGLNAAIEKLIQNYREKKGGKFWPEAPVTPGWSGNVLSCSSEGLFTGKPFGLSLKIISLCVRAFPSRGEMTFERL